MADLIFAAQFVTARVGKTGLTVTVDVDRYTISDGSRTALVTGGAATEGRRGLYSYRLASADLALYQYIATFVTTNTTVDQQEIPTLGLVVPDAQVSAVPAGVWDAARSGHAGAGTFGATDEWAGSVDEAAIAAAVLDAADSDPISANVTYSAGVALSGRLAEYADLPAAAPTAAAIRTEMDSNSTKLANLDATVSSRLAASGYTAPLDAAGVRTAVGLATANLDTQLATIAGYIDTEVAAILEDTGTTLPATLATLATAAALTVVDANVDAIKVITDQIDVTAVTQVAASSAGHLTITAALTFNESVTGLTIPATWVTALWTLKADASKPDTAALVQLRETNPAALTDGLVRLNGAAVASPLTAASGALTVTQASGRIGIYLTDELTALLDDATGLGWDVKFIDAAGDSSGSSGTADVVLTETKATA